jgi:hypothetical protein
MSDPGGMPAPVFLIQNACTSLFGEKVSTVSLLDSERDAGAT